MTILLNVYGIALVALIYWSGCPNQNRVRNPFQHKGDPSVSYILRQLDLIAVIAILDPCCAIRFIHEIVAALTDAKCQPSKAVAFLCAKSNLAAVDCSKHPLDSHDLFVIPPVSKPGQLEIEL